MRSVRLDEGLELKLEKAARITGQSVSTIIREAIEQRCEHILDSRLKDRLADVTGIVQSGGGKSRRTGKAFVETLKSKGGGRP